MIGIGFFVCSKTKLPESIWPSIHDQYQYYHWEFIEIELRSDWYVKGEPDTDYPILASVQQTAFSCDGLIFGGYYADPETRCQQYSVCLQV